MWESFFIHILHTAPVAYTSLLHSSYNFAFRTDSSDLSRKNLISMKYTTTTKYLKVSLYRQRKAPKGTDIKLSNCRHHKNPSMLMFHHKT